MTITEDNIGIEKGLTLRVPVPGHPGDYETVASRSDDHTAWILPKILIWRGHSILDWAIRFQTDSKEAAHTALWLPSGKVIEAIATGVAHDLPSSPISEAQVFDVNLMTPAMWMTAVTFGLQQVGKPYDYLGLVRFITRRLNDEEERKAWFCSDLVFAIVAAGGINLLRRVPFWKVSPEGLRRSPRLIEGRMPK